MNKEQQALLEDAYKNYINKTKFPGGDIVPKIEFMYHDNSILSQEQFINKIKTDDEFAKKWELKIEERELDMFERWKIADLTPNMMEIDYCNKLCEEYNVPTKLITITYSNKTIESYN
jgi:hypothetical protein